MTDATHIEIDAEPRYWEDAIVNGRNEDDDAPTVYGSAGKLWKVRIRLTDGYVVGWPTGMTADVHYKVCDQGLYYLTNDAGQRLFKWAGDYVPDDFLCPDSSGYGDYIILKIGADGMINGWIEPDIEPDEWVSVASLNVGDE